MALEQSERQALRKEMEANLETSSCDRKVAVPSPAALSPTAS
jgi:hypothetical protein